MKITPKTMSLIYEMLRYLPPFNRWRLPHESFICFAKLKNYQFFGDFTPHDQRPRIRITTKVKTLPMLVETMAHEMCHLKEGMSGRDNGEEHGKEFKRLANIVCKELGFREKDF